MTPGDERLVLAPEAAEVLGVGTTPTPRCVLGMELGSLTREHIELAWRRQVEVITRAGMPEATTEAAVSVLREARRILLHALGVDVSNAEPIVLTPLDEAIRDAMATGRGWDRRTRRRVFAAAEVHGLPLERLPQVLRGLGVWMNAQRGTADAQAVFSTAPESRRRAGSVWTIVSVAVSIVLLLVLVQTLARRDTPAPTSTQAATANPSRPFDPPIDQTQGSPAEAIPIVEGHQLGVDPEVAAARDRLARPGRAAVLVAVTIESGNPVVVQSELIDFAMDLATAHEVLDPYRRQPLSAGLHRAMTMLDDRPTELDATLGGISDALEADPRLEPGWSAWLDAARGAGLTPVLAEMLQTRWPEPEEPIRVAPEIADIDVQPTVVHRPENLLIESWRARWRALDKRPRPRDPQQMFATILAWRLLDQAAATMVLEGSQASVLLGRLLLLEDRQPTPPGIPPLPRSSLGASRHDDRLAYAMNDMGLLMRDRLNAVERLGKDREQLGPRDAAALAAVALGPDLAMRKAAQRVILGTRALDPLVVRSVLDALPDTTGTQDVLGFVDRLADVPVEAAVREPVGQAQDWLVTARRALAARAIELQVLDGRLQRDAVEAQNSAMAEAALVSGVGLTESDGDHVGGWQALAGAWAASVGVDRAPGGSSPVAAVVAQASTARSIARWMVDHGLDPRQIDALMAGLPLRLHAQDDAFGQLIEAQRTIAGLWGAWFEFVRRSPTVRASGADRSGVPTSGVRTSGVRTSGGGGGGGGGGGA